MSRKESSGETVRGTATKKMSVGPLKDSEKANGEIMVRSGYGTVCLS